MAAEQQLYGGQAVIEGVMMRGAQHFAVACLRVNGQISLTCELVPKILRPAWQKVPFLRGVFALVDAMTLGTKALFWAARIAEMDIPPAETASANDRIQEIRRSEEAVGAALGTAVTALDLESIETIVDTKAAPRSSRVSDVAIGSAMAMGLVFALILIVVFPNLIISGAKWAGVTTPWKLGLIDGTARIGIFFGYIVAIARMPHVRRVFQFHGAEHKTINTLEAGQSLTVANARSQSRLHPRCGTSFIFIVLLLSTAAFIPFYGLPVYLRLPIHLLLSLPVASVAFELLRLAGLFRANPVAHALSMPGMWTQLLTTREPDDAQLAVAIASLKAVMDADNPIPLPPDVPAAVTVIPELA